MPRSRRSQGSVFYRTVRSGYQQTPRRLGAWLGAARGRLSQVVVGSSTTTYLYDGLGQRIRKSGGPAGIVHYVYAAPGQLLGQYNASGQAVQEVVWLDDLPLALLSTQETIRDNTATGTATGTTYVGTWSTLTSPHGYWGSNYRSAAVDTSAQPASATWRLNVSGSHKLYARWPVQANASAQASYQIQHSAGSTTVRVDQRQDGTAWVYLGQYLLSPSSLITLSAQPDGVVAADAIKAVSTNEAARVFYVHSDHLNTPRTVVNTQGQLRWRWLTEPWGQQPPEDNPSNLGVFTTALRLPGQLYDVESTLHYNTYRDYFPDLGRYLQSDPIGLEGGINTYSYVNGNPVSMIDPLGLTGCFVNFPDFPITVPGTSWQTTLTPGHAGALGYDSATGATRYYEYGRYDSDFGNVRRRRMPNLEIGKDGQPTPGSMKVLQEALSRRAGEGTRAELSCERNIDEKKMYDYAEKLLRDANRPPYSWKPWASNTCRDFARRALDAGRP